MAITVENTASGTVPVGAGATTINFTAAENDLVVVVAAHRTGGGALTINTSGYTIIDFTGGHAAAKLAHKKMGGTPDTGIEIAQEGVVEGEVVIWVLRGQDTTTPQDAVATTSAGSEPPDGPSITTVTNAAWVLSAVAATSTVAATAPTGYGNLVKHDNATFLQVAGAWKEVAVAGAENPGAWGGIVGTNNDLVTWAVRPAVVAGGGGAANMLLLGVG
jgi:hypothetical protein